MAHTVHRPLTLTAITLAPTTGGETLVLVEADLGAWKSQETCRDFLSRLHQELSVEPTNLIFALSHAHSAPLLMDADDSLCGSGLHRMWMAVPPTMPLDGLKAIKAAEQCVAASPAAVRSPGIALAPPALDERVRVQ